MKAKPFSRLFYCSPPWWRTSEFDRQVISSMPPYQLLHQSFSQELWRTYTGNEYQINSITFSRFIKFLFLFENYAFGASSARGAAIAEVSLNETGEACEFIVVRWPHRKVDRARYPLKNLQFRTIILGWFFFFFFLLIKLAQRLLENYLLSV